MKWHKEWQKGSQARWTSDKWSIVATQMGEGWRYTVWKGKTTSYKMAEMVGTYDTPSDARQAADRRAALESVGHDEP